ncbi:hypothetical protein EYF80_001653 [Liparis tanakae]|uniref:Uncharacterized protein n=1 Tax=Liparis tanakae TaxID=230148 RepID=A0A4Z2JFN5_9TELE|nr:hypothetical protein EYF80_001653 [Liparis tanakae]
MCVRQHQNSPGVSDESDLIGSLLLPQNDSLVVCNFKFISKAPQTDAALSTSTSSLTRSVKRKQTAAVGGWCGARGLCQPSCPPPPSGLSNFSPGSVTIPVQDSAVMDGATMCGLVWASAPLKCMGRGLEGWDERSRRRDEKEGPEEIYGKKSRER